MGSWAHNALIIGELFFGDYFFVKYTETVCVKFRRAGVASPSVTQNKTRGRRKVLGCTGSGLLKVLVCLQTANQFAGVLCLFQNAGTTAAAEPGLLTPRLKRGAAPREQGQPCQIQAGVGRCNEAGMSAGFSSEVHLK